MRSSITAEHAEYNKECLRESRAEFEAVYGFENPPSGQNGWIEPNGTLMANRYESHVTFCDMWYGLSEEEVEKTHVKLSAGIAYFYGKRITSRQAKTLLDYGYDPEDMLKYNQTERND